MKAPQDKFLVFFVSSLHGDITMGSNTSEVVCDSLMKALIRAKHCEISAYVTATIFDDQGEVCAIISKETDQQNL